MLRWIGYIYIFIPFLACTYIHIYICSLSFFISMWGRILSLPTTLPQTAYTYSNLPMTNPLALILGNHSSFSKNKLLTNNKLYLKLRRLNPNKYLFKIKENIIMLSRIWFNLLFCLKFIMCFQSALSYTHYISNSDQINGIFNRQLLNFHNFMFKAKVKKRYSA